MSNKTIQSGITKEDISRNLKILKQFPRSKYILLGRLAGTSLQSIADKLNLSRQRVAQMEEAAIKKIK